MREKIESNSFVPISEPIVFLSPSGNDTYTEESWALMDLVDAIGMLAV